MLIGSFERMPIGDMMKYLAMGVGKASSYAFLVQGHQMQASNWKKYAEKQNLTLARPDHLGSLLKTSKDGMSVAWYRIRSPREEASVLEAQ